MPNAAFQRMQAHEPLDIHAADAAIPLEPDDLLADMLDVGDKAVDDLPLTDADSAFAALPSVSDDTAGDLLLDGLDVEEKDDMPDAGALQGPLQGDESKGGALSVPGTRSAVGPGQKRIAPAEKKPAMPAPSATQKARISKREDVNPKRGTTEYGNVKFADPTNHKYPIDTADHVRAAWSYINKPKNAGKYDPDEVKAIKGRIKAAAKKFGVAIADDSNDKEKAYISPRPPAWWNRNKIGVTITKDADGLRLMPSITSNSYKDREAETVATKALAEYVDDAWNRVEGRCEPENDLQFWHGGVIGKTIWCDMEGPFLLEVHKELPNKRVNMARKGQPPRMMWIKDVWDYIEANPDEFKWGASHGFEFFKRHKSKDGTYKHIRKFESSVLPLQWAANPYTFSGVVDMGPRDKLLNNMVGERTGKAFRKGARSLNKALQARGLQHKDRKPARDVDADDDEKALIEDLDAQLDEAIGELADTPSMAKAIKSAVLSVLQQSGGDEGEPDGDEADPSASRGTQEEAAAGYRYAARRSADDFGGDAEDEPDDEEESGEEDKKPMAKKQLALLDTLIDTQQGIYEGIEEIAARQKALDPLIPLPKQLANLEKRFKALEARLNMRPAAASESDETVVEDEALLDAIKESMSNFDPFFGVHVAPED